MGIALLVMSTVDTFSQTGFQAALIQRKDDVSDYLSSAWTVGVLRGFALFALLFLTAPFAASFFEAPQAKFIVRIVAFSLLFEGFTNIGVIYFQRELKFHKQFVYRVTGTLADFIVAISAALILRNVWALVFGLLAGNVVRLVMSYVLHPFRPHLCFESGTLKDLFGYGKWVFCSAAVVFLVTQGDDVLVGKLLGVTMLGFYQIAYRISSTPATEISHIAAQVTFPALSTLQDDLTSLRKAYLRVLQMTVFLSVIVVIVILGLGGEITVFFLGEKWLPIVPAMQILVIAGLFRAIAASAGYLFYAVGKPRLDTRLQVFRLSILAVSIYPLTKQLGIAGSALAVLTSITLASIGFMSTVTKITGCTFRDLVYCMSPSFIGGASGVMFIIVLKTMCITGLTQIVLLACTGIAGYIGMHLIADRCLGTGIKCLIKDGIHAVRFT